MRLWTASSNTVTLFVVSITASSAVSNSHLGNEKSSYKTAARASVLPQWVLRLKPGYRLGCKGLGKLLTNALEVFQLPQENGDEGVVLEMVLCSSFEENVGFIEKENGLPSSDKV